MSAERWFPRSVESPFFKAGVLPAVMGRDGKRWLVVRAETREDVEGMLTVRVVNGNECGAVPFLSGRDDYRCKHCDQRLQTEHLDGCPWLEE